MNLARYVRPWAACLSGEAQAQYPPGLPDKQPREGQLLTLWILIIGFKNAAGTISINTTGGQPVMQALATYRTQKECDTASQGNRPVLAALPGDVSLSMMP